jgi:hypothetical protein
MRANETWSMVCAKDVPRRSGCASSNPPGTATLARTADTYDACPSASTIAAASGVLSTTAKACTMSMISLTAKCKSAAASSAAGASRPGVGASPGKGARQCLVGGKPPYPPSRRRGCGGAQPPSGGS